MRPWAHLGVNAIGKMYLIYQALIDLDEKRGREVHFPLYRKGVGALLSSEHRKR